MDKETSWVYNNVATVAVVGKEARYQFGNTYLSLEEIRHSAPFVCFDAPASPSFDFRMSKEDMKEKTQAAELERIALCKTDLLFVLSELNDTEESALSLLYAEQLKDGGLSFFVTHERNQQKNEMSEIREKFSHIIFVEDNSVELFYAVKQLLCDYYRPGFIGIDMADVYSVFPKEHKRTSFYSRRKFSDIISLKNVLPQIAESIDDRINLFASSPDFLSFHEMPQSGGLEDIEEVAVSIAERYGDSQYVWSANFNAKADDESHTLSLQAIF